jgi:hypothetical protein
VLVTLEIFEWPNRQMIDPKSNENRLGHKLLVSSFAPPCVFSIMTAAALITENNEKQVEKESEIILKSGTGNLLKTENLTNEKQSISNTKDLLKKAREAANQKFSMTINKDRNENLNKFHSPVMDRNVLKREESPAWYGQVIKTKLKRTAEPPSKKKTSMIADKMHKPDFSVNVQASKSLYDYYKKVRGEYEDFKEIEAARLQKRLEKFSDFPKNSKKTFEGKKDMNSSCSCSYMIF